MTGYRSRNDDIRESVMMRARVWTAAARLPTEHRVRNLSPSGACLDHARQLKLGASVRISIGQVLDIPALVAWIHADKAGVEFEYPINLVAARRHFGHMPSAGSSWIDNRCDAYRR